MEVLDENHKRVITRLSSSVVEKTNKTDYYRCLSKFVTTNEIRVLQALEASGIRNTPRFLGQTGPYSFKMSYLDIPSIEDLQYQTTDNFEALVALISEINRAGIFDFDLNDSDILFCQHAGNYSVIDFGACLRLPKWFKPFYDQFILLKKIQRLEQRKLTAQSRRSLARIGEF